MGTGKLGKGTLPNVKGIQIDTTNAACISEFWKFFDIKHLTWVIVHKKKHVNVECQKKTARIEGQRVKMTWHNKNEANSYSHERPKWHANTSGLTINLRFIIRKAQNPMEAARDRPLHPRANVLKGFFWSPGFFYDFCARNLVDFCVWASQQKNKNLIEKPHKTYGQTEKKTHEIHQNEFIWPKKSSHWWNVMDRCHWGRLFRLVSLEVRQLPF